MTMISGKVVAVTGAASGIGRALAQTLAAEGAHLAIADVNEAGLRETAAMLSPHTQVSQHRVDVRDRAAVEAFAQAVKAAHGGADVIINNAGVATRVSIEDSSYEDLEFVIGVNLWGVIHGTKAFLPLFRERGAGHIVNIASINAMVPFPLNGPYNISKYGVYGLNETLMQELRGQTIHVTSVHPGGVRTNIVANGRNMGEDQAKAFARVARTSPGRAARVIVDGIKNNRQRVFVGVDSKIMATAKRIAPGPVVALTGMITERVWGAR
ncbi:MAG TPA: SDR family NAD(P)-dependent oxidoreductase [Polyangiales bacterium]|nr:SDR family NAD(P)-dependent oxidoreductase [Polyangiales bacterium]